ANEAGAHGLHLAATALVGHRPAKAVGLGIGEPGEAVGDLEDLLLEEEDALGLRQDRAEGWGGRPEVVNWFALPRRMHRVTLLLLLSLSPDGAGRLRPHRHLLRLAHGHGLVGLWV